MTTLTIELPLEVYQRLQHEATRVGTPTEELAQGWLVERLTPARPDLSPPAPPGERERATEILRAAGLLTELSPEEKVRAAQADLTLEEARAILDRAGGKPLSEIIIEMRGPKE